MEIEVLFFGILAEVACTRVKWYRDIASMADLRMKILDDYPRFLHYNYRICHNNMIQATDPVLKSGDQVALLPPFEGG